MLNGVAVDPLVDFLGGNPRPDSFGHHVEHADVNGGASLYGLNVAGAFQQVARGNFEAFVVEFLQALIRLPVAFLVFLTAAAPAFIVAAGLAFAVVHVSPRFASAM